MPSTAHQKGQCPLQPHHGTLPSPGLAKETERKAASEMCAEGLRHIPSIPDGLCCDAPVPGTTHQRAQCPLQSDDLVGAWVAAPGGDTGTLPAIVADDQPYLPVCICQAATVQLMGQ